MIGLQKDQLNPVHQNMVMGKFHTYGLLTALVEFTLTLLFARHNS